MLDYLVFWPTVDKNYQACKCTLTVQGKDSEEWEKNLQSKPQMSSFTWKLPRSQTQTQLLPLPHHWDAYHLCWVVGKGNNQTYLSCPKVHLFMVIDVSVDVNPKPSKMPFFLCKKTENYFKQFEKYFCEKIFAWSLKFQT